MTVLRVLWNCMGLFSAPILTWTLARIVKQSGVIDSGLERGMLMTVVIMWGIGYFFDSLLDLLKGRW